MSETVSKAADTAGAGKYTIDMLKEKIQEVLDEDGVILQLFFLLQKKNGNGRTVELRSVDFKDEEDKARIAGYKPLKDIYVDHLKEMLLENSSAALLDLSTGDGDSDDIYLCEPGQLPEELKEYLELDSKKVYTFDKNGQEPIFFNFGSDKLNDLYGYIAFIGTMDKWMALFTKHYPITVIKRDAYLLGVIKDKARFEKVNEEDVLRITGKAHLLKIDDRTFVLDLDALERGMGYKKKIEDKAQEIVGNMKTWTMFANSDELNEIAKDYCLARKLLRAKKCSPVLEPPGLVPWEKVVRYIRETPELSAVLKLDDAPKDEDKKVSLPNQKARKMFVALLDDDYLQSALSEFLYVAPHKKTVSEKKPANATEEEQA